jgi:hypothetical protein
MELRQFVADRVLTLPEIKGSINAQIAFKGGSLDDIQASLDGRVSGLTFKDWPLGQLALSSQIQSRRVTFATKSDDSNGAADLAGTVILSENPTYEATLRTTALDLKKVAAAKRELPAARINLDAWVKGRGINPDSMQAETRLTLTGSQISGIQLTHARAEGSLRNGTVLLKNIRLDSEGSTLNAVGTLSMKPDGKGRITYFVNARQINPWVKLAGLDAGGCSVNRPKI